MPTDAGTVRWTVLFAGNVQGVGFRYTTRRVAEGFQVTGYVRNRSDGGVDVVAEGHAEELARFLDAVEVAMAGCIRERKRADSPATGEFSDFSVRF